MRNVFLMSCLFLISSASFISASEIERAIKLSNLANLTQQKELLNAAANAEKIISKATSAMIIAESDYLHNRIPANTFDEIMYKESYSRAEAEQNLKQTINKILSYDEVNQVPESYLARVKRSLMAWYGYEVTEEQKQARQKLNTLLAQKQIVQNHYDLVTLDDTLEVSQREALNRCYEVVFIRIDRDIYKQQIAMGNKWVLLKKTLFTGVIISAGIVAELLFSNMIWTPLESK